MKLFECIAVLALLLQSSGSVVASRVDGQSLQRFRRQPHQSMKQPRRLVSDSSSHHRRHGVVDIARSNAAANSDDAFSGLKRRSVNPAQPAAGGNPIAGNPPTGNPPNTGESNQNIPSSGNPTGANATSTNQNTSTTPGSGNPPSDPNAGGNPPSTDPNSGNPPSGGNPSEQSPNPESQDQQPPSSNPPNPPTQEQSPNQESGDTDPDDTDNDDNDQEDTSAYSHGPSQNQTQQVTGHGGHYDKGAPPPPPPPPPTPEHSGDGKYKNGSIEFTIVEVTVIFDITVIDIPQNLGQAPSKEGLVYNTFGHGIQSYDCKQGNFTLVKTDAKLKDCDGNKLGSLHFDNGVYKFNFTESQHDSNAYFIGHLAHSIESPDGAKNLAWIEIDKNSGGLNASTVFRVNTVGGQPPQTSCHEGDHFDSKFAAQFAFYK